jgi:hypothetical protein
MGVFGLLLASQLPAENQVLSIPITVLLGIPPAFALAAIFHSGAKKKRGKPAMSSWALAGFGGGLYALWARFGSDATEFWVDAAVFVVGLAFLLQAVFEAWLGRREAGHTTRAL